MHYLANKAGNIDSHVYFCRMENEWFATWFNTPYYHLLYRHRDLNEARSFIDQWLKKHPLPVNSHLLDLACGRGRHAVQLADNGYRVTGIDLSEENIVFADKHFAREGLSFVQGDMRHNLGSETYDAVVNLFTSFGYFDTQKENQQVFDNIHKALKKGSVFLFDYLNPNALSQINTDPEIKVIDGVQFDIQRRIDGEYVIKTIHVSDKDSIHTFYEKVKLISPETFRDMLKSSGFTIEREWGDYQLSALHTDSSPRYITLARK